MPMPASVLPVAIASSSWSVEPAKLISSTSRLCFWKMPWVTATGIGDRQIAVAFQASLTGTGRAGAVPWA